MKILKFRDSAYLWFSDQTLDGDHAILSNIFQGLLKAQFDINTSDALLKDLIYSLIELPLICA